MLYLTGSRSALDCSLASLIRTHMFCTKNSLLRKHEVYPALKLLKTNFTLTQCYHSVHETQQTAHNDWSLNQVWNGFQGDEGKSKMQSEHSCSMRSQVWNALALKMTLIMVNFTKRQTENASFILSLLAQCGAGETNFTRSSFEALAAHHAVSHCKVS